MLFVSILHHYLLWHYTYALLEIFHIWNNFFWFIINFFSLPQLIRSYFAPWKRMTEDRGQTFNFEDLAGFVVIGLISRIVGMILRTTIILFGTTALILLTIGGLLVYLFWLLAPAVLIGSLLYGIILMFS